MIFVNSDYLNGNKEETSMKKSINEVVVMINASPIYVSESSFCLRFRKEFEMRMLYVLYGETGLKKLKLFKGDGKTYLVKFLPMI